MIQTTNINDWIVQNDSIVTYDSGTGTFAGQKPTNTMGNQNVGSSSDVQVIYEPSSRYPFTSEVVNARRSTALYISIPTELVEFQCPTSPIKIEEININNSDGLASKTEVLQYQKNIKNESAYTIQNPQVNNDSDFGGINPTIVSVVNDLGNPIDQNAYTISPAGKNITFYSMGPGETYSVVYEAEVQTVSNLQIKNSSTVCISEKSFSSNVIQLETFDNSPVINANNIALQVGNLFNPLLANNGLIPLDVEDGDITEDITVSSNNVNQNKERNYTVVYQVVDSDGNTSYKVVSVRVDSNKAPRISVNPSEVEVGSDFDPLNTNNGLSATDKEDGDLTSDIKVEFNNVDPTKEKMYKVVYSVEDSDCNKTIQDGETTVLENLSL